MRLEHAMEWPIKAIVRHFENRLFELAMTISMLGISIWIMVWPDSIDAGSLQLLHKIPASTLVSIYFFLGCWRIAALIANGNWPFYGPLIRAFCAFLAAVVWAQMSAALFLWAEVTHRSPSIETPVYGTLALFELISMYRAMARAGYDGSVGKSGPEVGD